MGVYAQDGYAVRQEWGPAGVAALGAGCAVLVVVDVLVFTTSVDIAVGRGATVIPTAAGGAEAVAQAERAGALHAPSGLRRDADGTLRADVGTAPTLRPSTLGAVPAGTVILMPSRNGSVVSAAAAATGATVLAGCLRNASAVAAAATAVADGRPIGVVPAGERWYRPADPADSLRPALEELLGAGAITAALSGLHRSPEAEVSALAFLGARPRVAEILDGCVGGRELTAAGLAADVPLAAAVDVSDTVPVLVDGAYRGWTG